jgi:hypothetical protein
MPGIFGNEEVDDDRDLARARAAWEASAGQPGTPVFAPALSGAAPLNRTLRDAGFSPTLRNSEFWQQQARAGANAGFNANPYSNAIADQSRGAQLGLMQQMRGQMAGPSIAGMQATRALGQSGQQALQNAAMGAPGRAGMVQAGQVGGGLANDAGQARLAEIMRAQAGLGGAAGNLRGADIRSAEASQRAGLGQLGLDLANRQGYAALGARQQGIEDAARTELYKALERAKLAKRQDDIATIKGAMGPLATLFGGWVDAASKGKK